MVQISHIEHCTLEEPMEQNDQFIGRHHSISCGLGTRLQQDIMYMM